MKFFFCILPLWLKHSCANPNGHGRVFLSYHTHQTQKRDIWPTSLETVPFATLLMHNWHSGNCPLLLLYKHTASLCYFTLVTSERGMPFWLRSHTCLVISAMKLLICVSWSIKCSFSRFRPEPNEDWSKSNDQKTCSAKDALRLTQGRSWITNYQEAVTPVRQLCAHYKGHLQYHTTQWLNVVTSLSIIWFIWSDTRRLAMHQISNLTRSAVYAVVNILSSG
jgi:hypothetical protein